MLTTKQIEYLYRGVQEEVLEGIQLSETKQFATCDALRQYTIALNNGEDATIPEQLCRGLVRYWETYFEESPLLANKYLELRRQAAKDLSIKFSKEFEKRFVSENFLG